LVASNAIPYGFSQSTLWIALLNPQANAIHPCLQPPQLIGSFEKLTQALPQRFSPPVQDLEQVELLQVAVPVPAVIEQTLPQAPQLLLSLERLEQALPHAVNPALQLGEHVELEQAAVPFVTAGQAFPQAPQLLTLVCRFVSHPLAGF
jgi:hypothetical protein